MTQKTQKNRGHLPGDFLSSTFFENEINSGLVCQRQQRRLFVDMIKRISFSNVSFCGVKQNKNIFA